MPAKYIFFDVDDTLVFSEQKPRGKKGPSQWVGGSRVWADFCEEIIFLNKLVG